MKILKKNSRKNVSNAPIFSQMTDKRLMMEKNQFFNPTTKEISTQEAQCSVSDTASVEQFYTISPCPHFLPWNPNFWYSSSLGQKEKRFKGIFQKNEN